MLGRLQGAFLHLRGRLFMGILCPIVYLIPYDTHMNRGRFNAYIGSGIGYVYVSREDRFSFDDTHLSCPELLLHSISQA
jgi:hypothetical protein